MNKSVIVCFIFLGLVCASMALSSSTCPSSHQMTTCSPRCKDDTECHGRKCCPDICNAKSCAPANQGQDNKYNKGQSSATGSYCGNTKCNSYEKCELDRTTKKQKCVRS